MLSAALDRYYGPIRHPPDCLRLPGVLRLYVGALRDTAAAGRGGSLQFLHLPSDRSAPHTPTGSSALLLQVLHAFHGLRREQRGSAPACPRKRGAVVTGRQDLLNAADRSVAPAINGS